MRKFGLVLVTLALLSCGSETTDKLRDAIQNDDVEAVRTELSKKPFLEPNCQPNYNCKPLGYAAMFGNIEIIKLLIEAGADPNGLGAYGDVPLIEVYSAETMADRTDEEITAVQIYLMEHGADPNIPNDFGISPFMGFCKLAEFEKMEVALEHGADVNGSYASRISGENNTTASVLMVTIYDGEAEAVRWLIDHGADVNYRNSEGKSILQEAKRKGNQEIVTMLVEAGATE